MQMQQVMSHPWFNMATLEVMQNNPGKEFEIVYHNLKLACGCC